MSYRPAAQSEVVLDGHTYRLHAAAGDPVTVHVELPNYLREQLREAARRDGRTIKATVEAALTAHLADTEHPAS